MKLGLRGVVLAASLCLTLGLAACGGDDGGSDETSSSGSSDGKGEVTARAAGDAFLAGVRDADEAVICGLLDEEYAQQLTRSKEFGVAECVRELKGETFSQIQSQLKDVKVQSVTLTNGGDTGIITLSNDKTIAVKWDGSRYVITRLGS